MADLLWMRQNGMETAVVRLARQGIPIIGICGGYQMLGSICTIPKASSMAGACTA